MAIRFGWATLLSSMLVLAVQPGMAQKMATQPVVAKEISPPSVGAQVSIPSSVVLKAGNFSKVLSTLKVKRQISGASLRSQPQLPLGTAKVNMQPLFANPAALPNVASRLRTRPALVRVRAEEVTAYEVDQGLIVRSFLSYETKPGACSTATSRALMTAAGAPCSTRLTASARAAAFANPKDTRYVADPALRAKAIKEAEAESAKMRAELDADVANLRAELGSPPARAQLEAEFGAAEVARMAKLSDSELEEEVINRGVTSVDEIMFIPKADRLDLRKPSVTKLKDIASKEPPVKSTRELDSRIFLTGFTLGKSYEWKRMIEKTFKVCIIKCLKKTYWVGASAALGYGAGLRFPVRIGGTYDYLSKGGKKTATLTPKFEAIDGSAADYAAAGLASENIFEGKEVVAQFGFEAKFGYDFPFSSNNINEKWNRDFTKDFPAPFTNGQFTPPAPGTSTPGAEKVFDDSPAFDLLLGRANFKIVGIQLFPALKIALKSEALRFTMLDRISGQETLLEQSGTPVNLGIDSDNSSKWTIGNPTYNLAFELTPGLSPRLFLDLAVWSTEWNYQVWFPQVSVTLPPGGVNFGCHSGTVCARDYRFSPSGQSESDSDESPLGLEIDKWGIDFAKRWTTQCVDKQCKSGIPWLRQGAVAKAKTLEQKGVEPKFQDPLKLIPKRPATINDMKPFFDQADLEAAAMVKAARTRKIEKDASSYALLAEGSWSPRCSDDLCRTNIKKLSQDYKAAWIERMTANPDGKLLGMSISMNKEWVPRFQKEIDESAARMRRGTTPATVPPVREKL